MSIINENNNFNYIYPLLGSEIALSLYPQLIKLVPATLEVQIAVRCISYFILALIGISITPNTNKNKNEKEINVFSFINAIMMSIITIIHIISSYTSFKLLTSGVSYALFYTYPIFNLLGRSIFYNEKIKFINYIYILIAILGVYLIYSKDILKNILQKDNLQKDNLQKDNLQNDKQNKIEKSDNKYYGFIAGITSALTESLIYFIVKSDIPSVSPFTQVIKTYLLGGILSIGYIIKNIKTINLDINYWITLILFNSIIGFLGYILRFFTIPRLSTLKFNSIIFVGVIFSYIWGYIFSNENIEFNNIIGTLLILVSIFMINY
jgi:drug/metabolite transporter (DMT)-like permease